MADARVGEQSLEVRLRNGRKISEDHGGTGEDRDDRHDLGLQVGNDDEGFEHAQQNDESRSFRGDGEVSGNRGGCALVNIGHPELEWGCGDLEAERDKDESETEEQRGNDRVVESGQGFGDGREIGVSGYAVDPGDAVNKEPGGERAEHEILRPGLEAGRAAAQVRDEDVESYRDQLERDENHDEVRGRCHPHQSRAGEDGQGKELPDSGAAAFGRHARFDGRSVFHRHDEHDHGGKQGELLEKHGKEIGAVEIGVRRGGIHRGGIGDEGGGEDAEQSDDSRISDAAFVSRAGKGLCHEQDDAQDNNGNLEVERVHGAR